MGTARASVFMQKILELFSGKVQNRLCKLNNWREIRAEAIKESEFIQIS